jgi:hypothetical protein
MENPEAAEDGFSAAALKGGLRRKINAFSAARFRPKQAPERMFWQHGIRLSEDHAQTKK